MPENSDELVRISTVIVVTGSAYVAPLGIALMNANGAYGCGNEKLSRPLISPDWNACPAIVERENMSAPSISPGSPSARNAVRRPSST